MVANYTPAKKFRKEDDFTPGGRNDRRPDRACIAYTNLIKKHCKGRPILLAGIEASLRRIAHYDYWSDSVRRSILFDSKADAVVYGMGELTNLEIAGLMRDGKDWKGVDGICVASSQKPEDCIELPSYEEVSDRNDRRAFMKAYSIFRHNSDPITASPLCQRHGDRWLVQNRPRRSMTSEELDSAYGSDFENAVHPYYAKDGKVKAMETIRNSITTHRGCYGDCSFCAIAVHQGTTVVSRSEDSILEEARGLASSKGFNGVIQDVGGPTANMYGIECSKKTVHGRCENRRCLVGKPCPRLPIDHSRQTALLQSISDIDGIRHVFVNSGIRHDMILADRRNGPAYLESLVSEHVSGQMKIAPEHVCDGVLDLMGKPRSDVLKGFKRMFNSCCSRMGRNEFLTYYFIAAHPGCTDDDMKELARFCGRELSIHPEQVQVFTPTPSTYSTAMWWCGCDIDGELVYVERSMQRRQHQKDIVVGKRNARRPVRSPDSPLQGIRRPRGSGVRPEEGLLLRVVHPLRSRNPADIRLSEGSARRRPRRFRRDDGAPREEPPMEGAGVVHRLRLVRGLHPHPPSRVHPQEQESPEDRCRGIRVHPRFRRQAPRGRSPATRGYRELLVLLDPQGQSQARRILRDHVPRGRDIVDPRFPGYPRRGQGLRRLSRMPASPPGLSAVPSRARSRVPQMGALVPGLGGVREGPSLPRILPPRPSLLYPLPPWGGMEQRGFIFHGTDGEAELSIEQVRELAAKDDPEGLYALAMAYLFGWDVEADEDRGYELLEKAVDLGNTDAMALMVRLYMQDEYQGIDNERAAELSVIAAKDGIPEAQLYAGLAYMDGIHVPQDYKEAARYLTLAANQGDQEARTALAYLYENGFGVAKDESKALKMYRTAARGGSVNAMFHVGVCYEFGNGTPVDLEQARSWYQKGAQAGDAFAMERLGHLTMQCDPESGFEWFLRAAMNGVPTAMGTVGFCYLGGSGTPEDVEEAKKWLKMAADNGIEEAADALQQLS